MIHKDLHVKIIARQFCSQITTSTSSGSDCLFLFVCCLSICVVKVFDSGSYCDGASWASGVNLNRKLEQSFPVSRSQRADRNILSVHIYIHFDRNAHTRWDLIKLFCENATASIIQESVYCKGLDFLLDS